MNAEEELGVLEEREKKKALKKNRIHSALGYLKILFFGSKASKIALLAVIKDLLLYVLYSMLAPTSFNSVNISVKKLGSELILSIDVLSLLTMLTHLSQKRSLSVSTKKGFRG